MVAGRVGAARNAEVHVLIENVDRFRGKTAVGKILVESINHAHESCRLV